MPTIAQKLCNDIVEPILAPSSSEIATLQSGKSSKSIRYTKPTKSVLVEKKKVISQVEPNSKTILNKLKSKEILLRKDFIDAGVNTLISGPLRCDNNCVTNVRKREYCSCKHNQKKKSQLKTCAKHIQTLNKSCSRTDKATTHYIDTTNCSTQFIDNLNSRLGTQISNRLLLKRSNEFEPNVTHRNTAHSSHRISKTMCHNAKRWALSKYPLKGPDF